MEGRWVFGSREKNDKSKIFMVPVDNRKKKILLIPMIQKYIKPGSIIHSDYWRSYHCLKDLGYIHKLLIIPNSLSITRMVHIQTRSKWNEDAKHCMPQYGAQKGLHYGYLAQFLWKSKYHNGDFFTTIIDLLNECFNIEDISCAPKLKC